jgi:hypothetical protein
VWLRRQCVRIMEQRAVVRSDVHADCTANGPNNVPGFRLSE